MQRSRGWWLLRYARRLLRVTKVRRAEEGREAYLERVLSGKRARGLRELLVLRERRKAERLIKRRLPDLSHAAAQAQGVDVASLLLARTSLLSEQVSLLHEVFTAGGYETAQALADALEPALHAAPRGLRLRALPILTRVWLTKGDAARALALWQTAGADLPGHHPLRQALLLSLGLLRAPRFQTGRTLYPFLADVAVQAGEGEQVLDAITAAPEAILLNPELELVVHNALRRTDPSYLAAFNRFLARNALGRASFIRGAEPMSWLAQLTITQSSPASAVRGPLVSVIMSAHNAAQTIDYAIRSIMQQSYQSFELLVADDASTDGTFALLQQRYAHEPRLRLFRSRQNQGTYNVRNQLLAQARGELVTFQDADDLSLPTRLAEQVQVLRGADKVACVCEWLRVRPDGSVAFFPNGRAARLSIVSLMVKKATLFALGPYPPARVGADLDLYRRLLRGEGASRVARLPLPLLLGLWSEQSLTRSPLLQSLESGFRAPVRRRYSELVFRQDLFGSESVPSAVLLEELTRMGNYAPPSELLSEHEMGAR